MRGLAGSGEGSGGSCVLRPLESLRTAEGRRASAPGAWRDDAGAIAARSSSGR